MCVIREKSVLISVNHKYSILIPVNRARHPPFPTLFGNAWLWGGGGIDTQYCHPRRLTNQKKAHASYKSS